MPKNTDAQYDELCSMWEELDQADRKLIRGAVWLERRRMLKLILFALWMLAAAYLIFVSGDPAAVAAGIVLGITGMLLGFVNLFKR